MKDDWWDGTREGAVSDLYADIPELCLPFGPIQSVTSLKTFDDADVETVFASSNYNVDMIAPRPKIVLKRGYSWPMDQLRTVNGVCVIAIYGIGQGYIPVNGETPAVESTIPSDIQEAIKIFTARLYEHRGDEEQDIPDSSLILMAPYRSIKVGR